MFLSDQVAGQILQKATSIYYIPTRKAQGEKLFSPETQQNQAPKAQFPYFCPLVF
jgi:hypothetical protein